MVNHGRDKWAVEKWGQIGVTHRVNMGVCETCLVLMASATSPSSSS